MQCKHQVAARFADVLQRCEVFEVPDAQFTEILLSC